MVWPGPCADEMPEPELLDDPELLEDPEPDDPKLPEEPELDDPELPEEPLADPALLDDPALPEDELVPDEPPVPALAVLLWCAEPGRAKTITPAPTSPAAPMLAVAARSRACPRRRAAAAAHAFGSGEFIGIPFLVVTPVWVPWVGKPSGEAQTFL